MNTEAQPEPSIRVNLSNEEIETVLQGCRLNQRVAQKKLYTIYYRYAMSIALRYSSSYDNAVEITNDAFLKIYKDLKKFVPRFDSTAISFMAWFKKVVINSSIDYLRKYHKKEMMVTTDLEHVVLSYEHETAEQMFQYKEIMKAIQKLSPTYKAVFNLYVIEGFSHAEISVKLNIAEGTSKSNLSKARQNLQKLLQRE
ncbi:MAG TPA: RNA polymerase sigma factor [Hanamia sp.]|nr:RNA polymerase sigma factor [Hanamia sp.]